MVPNPIQAGHNFDCYSNISISNDLMYHACKHIIFKISICIIHIQCLFAEEPINGGSLTIKETWIVEPAKHPITIIKATLNLCDLLTAL